MVVWKLIQTFCCEIYCGEEIQVLNIGFLLLFCISKKNYYTSGRRSQGAFPRTGYENFRGSHKLVEKKSVVEKNEFKKKSL